MVWKEVELHFLTSSDADGRPPHFFQARLTSNPGDDVMLFGSAGLSVLVHPGEHPATGAVMDNVDLGADAVAALPQRVNVSGRSGVIYLKRGDVAPHVLAPHDPPLFVNRLDDPAPASPISNACNNSSSTDTSSSCS